MALQQVPFEAIRLLPELHQWLVTAPIGVFEHQGFGGLAPLAFLLREALLDLGAQQPTPGLQIDLQQVIAGLGGEALAVVCQQTVGGRAGPAQR